MSWLDNLYGPSGATGTMPTAPTGPLADQWQAAQNRIGTRSALLGYSDPSNPYQQAVRGADAGLSASQRTLLNYSSPSNPMLQAYRGSVSALSGAQRGALQYSNPGNPMLQAYRGATSAVSNAQRGVLGQRTALAGQQAGYIGQQQADVTARTGETQNEINAQSDVPDLAAVAEAQGYRGALNRVADTIGAPRAIGINTPQGFSGSLPVGVYSNPRTNADYIDQSNRNADAIRSLGLEGGRNALALSQNGVDQGQLGVEGLQLTQGDARTALTNAQQDAGYNVDRAQLNSGDLRTALANQQADAGYGVDQSRLNSQDARTALSNAEAPAQYQDQLAGLNSDASRLPPFPGAVLYTDPYTDASEYLTPAEADARNYDYQHGLQLQHVPQTYEINRASTGYANQQGPFPGMSESDLQNMLVNNLNQAGDPAFLEQLIGYYQQRFGLGHDAAAYRAGELIAAAGNVINTRNRQTNSSSGPPIQVPVRPSQQ